MPDQPSFPMSEIAAHLSYQAYLSCQRDPGQTFVALMAAAAISGHMISLSNEEMHAVLEEVIPIAMAKFLHITETKN